MNFSKQFPKSRLVRGKTGLLLIDTFERLFNPNENGHLKTGGIFSFVRIKINERISAQLITK